ncbi:Rho guanine nucleotide exchange factor 11 [Saguinus oedipus]|uniref:Rho guanine nucleotide exchange factor 11 n=1 Tax=Saguinus oedipus TaxID=9490 RepID=A0ABQ9TI91_SAGOE|nr:Rho guanine nucleotide exchange factor 11 [Saguinus oedipus]
METQAAREPEDDVTPTPSVISVTSHPWDPGSPGQAVPGGEGDNTQLPGLEGEQPEQENMALCSLEDLPPRTRNSGIWESPELDRNPAEEASSTEAAGGYKVVRKEPPFPGASALDRRGRGTQPLTPGDSTEGNRGGSWD